MTLNRKNILSVIGGVAVLSLVTPLTATANSKDGKKSGASSSAAAAAAVVASTRETTSVSTADLTDRKPGPAWKTIGGTVTHIKGDVYTIEDYEGNQVHLYVSRETKQLRGNKKVGDRVRAEITHGRFANSIQ
jgi:hypothetical protein